MEKRTVQGTRNVRIVLYQDHISITDFHLFFHIYILNKITEKFKCFSCSQLSIIYEVLHATLGFEKNIERAVMLLNFGIRENHALPST